MAKRTKKAVDLDQVVATLPKEEQAEIKAAQQRYLEACRALNLASLRKERGVTQVQLGEALGAGQHQVSRSERQHDMLVSSLRRHVEALGGRLVLAAVFPDGEPIVIEGLAPEAARQPEPAQS